MFKTNWTWDGGILKGRENRKLGGRHAGDADSWREEGGVYGQNIYCKYVRIKISKNK